MPGWVCLFMAQMGVGWLWQMKQGVDSATNWKVQVGDEENLPLEAATAQERSVGEGHLQIWWFSRCWWIKPWNANSRLGDARVQVSATSAGKLKG